MTGCGGFLTCGRCADNPADGADAVQAGMRCALALLSRGGWLRLDLPLSKRKRPLP